jgi:hypothetical protein
MGSNPILSAIAHTRVPPSFSLAKFFLAVAIIGQLFDSLIGVHGQLWSEGCLVPQLCESISIVNRDSVSCAELADISPVGLRCDAEIGGHGIGDFGPGM